METTKPIHFSAPFLILMALIQTLIGVLPGMIRTFHNQTDAKLLVFSFFAYLFLSEIFQFIARIAYRNGRFVAAPIYLLKLVISSLLIFSISSHATFQYGIILFCYEFFQFMMIAKRFAYLDTFFYTILNTFFKGLVFNLLISTQSPFVFTLDLLKPFIPAILLLFILTVFTQGFYSYFLRNRSYFLMGLGTTAIFYLYCYFNQTALGLSFPKILLVAVLNLIALMLFISSKYPKKKELFYDFFVLVTLLILYL